jgi:hypothetical protein
MAAAALMLSPTHANGFAKVLKILAVVVAVPFGCSRDRPETVAQGSVPSDAAGGASVRVLHLGDPEGTSSTSRLRFKEVETRSLAEYRQGVLRLCGDYSLATTSAEGGNTGFTPRQWEAIMVPRSSKEPNRTVLTQPCDQEFRKRATLAACAYRLGESDDAGSRAEIRAHVRYYDLAALEPGNSFKKQCLDLGGDWRQSLDDSDEVRAARVRETLSGLEGLSQTFSE